ncbi:sodium- and chloride-dependent glycine transporter 2-like isoform X2 [Dermacentor albipictus]|uniref:sodium- and chloride-dependent glycine transporter 2-like isoform X2 n=1 Tax=Dermacentor albipictus TaxID=60249 RepID=UPI0038FC3C1B
MSSGGDGGSGSSDAALAGPPDKDYYDSTRAIAYMSVCIALSYQCLTEFPYLLVMHGGMCFFLPYAVVLVAVGVPMAAFEMLIGQFRGKGCLEIWTCVPVGKGIGMAMLLKTFVICAYKAFENACTFFYFLQTFQDELPWSHCYTWWGASDLNCRERKLNETRQCQLAKENVYMKTQEPNYDPGKNATVFTLCGKVVTASYVDALNLSDCLDPRGYSENAFFLHGMLKVTNGIDEFGGIRWELLVCYIFTWFFIFVCTAQGVAAVGRISAVMGFLPACLMAAVAARALYLPGARSSVWEQFQPRWSCLWDSKAWSDAAFNVLTGLAIGLGQLHSLASYNTFDTTTLYWCYFLLPLGMTISNILCSVIVFGVGGSLAKQLGMCFTDFETYTFVFPFVIFAEVVKNLNWPKIWSGIFYGAVFLLSIDEMIFNVCTVVACAEDLFPSLRWNMNQTVFFVCIGMFISGFPTVTQAGAYIIRLLQEHTVKRIMSHFIPIAEICTVFWIYGLKRFSFDMEFMWGRPPNNYFVVCWLLFCPLIMTYPGEYEALAWIIGCTGLLQVPIGAFACVVENVRYPARAFQPEYHWEPNTPNRVNAYFEELEEQGDSSAEVQGVLYDATEALEVSIDVDEPLAFKPEMDDTEA